MKRIKRLIRKWIGSDCKERKYLLQLPTEMTNPHILKEGRNVVELKSEREIVWHQLYNIPETFIIRGVEDEILEELRKYIEVEIIKDQYLDIAKVRGSIKVIDKL